MFALDRREIQTAREDTLICLHSSGSSGRQWNDLRDSLPQYNIITPDLIGYGSHAWDESSPHSLAGESKIVVNIIRNLEKPVHLIGHSYGGVVALNVALKCPDKIQSLSLYEPVLFPLLFSSASQSGQEAWSLQSDVRRMVQRGKLEAAATRFIDYWNGANSYHRLPDRARASIRSMMPKVASEFAALMLEAISPSEFEALHIPTLLMTGENSPSTVLDVATLLADMLPNARSSHLPGAGHMAPVTEPEQVNGILKEFLNKFGGREDNTAEYSNQSSMSNA